jgi:DNA-binding response OmpR family regulator
MPGKVLVVEDSHVIQKLVKQVLNLRGFEVISARDGNEGLEMASKEEVDLILVDLLMPVKDGLEFLKELRNSKGPNSSTRAIVISGNESNLKLADFKDLGVMEIMEKPIDFDKLSMILEGF